MRPSQHCKEQQQQTQATRSLLSGGQELQQLQQQLARQLHKLVVCSCRRSAQVMGQESWPAQAQVMSQMLQ
jgi:hypothetical protein